MTPIKNKRLPKGVRQFIEDQNSDGGNVELFYNNIEDCIIKNKKIKECKYVEKNTELRWFSVNSILYIFVNDVNMCYYNKKEGLKYV